MYWNVKRLFSKLKEENILFNNAQHIYSYMALDMW